MCITARKKPKIRHEKHDFFDELPDDLVLVVLTKLCSTARSPADFISFTITCKRMNKLGLDPLVLRRAGPNTVAVRATAWSEPVQRFLKRFAAAGSNEALYLLGMIRFYCEQDQEIGMFLMARAAVRKHAPALYSLAVIHFNGSGGPKAKKNLHVAVTLCARAAYFGHIDALREIGHCFQDGYCVRQNVAEGRRLLIQANALELACSLRADSSPERQNLARRLKNLPPRNWLRESIPGIVADAGSLLSDSGFSTAVREPHPANRFLTEWFGSRGGNPEPGLRMCSHADCGRPETRLNEFRRCSVCGTVNYCSRGCQAQDWKLRHKVACTPPVMDQWWFEQDVYGGGYDQAAQVEGVGGTQ